MLWKTILVLLGSYLIGSIVTSDIVTKFKKADLRNQGSGNVGATNTFRVMGSVYGIIVLVGDVIKGIIAVLLARWLNPFAHFDLAIIAAVLVIVGHNWPVFFGFHGGKGISTSLGALIGLTPYSLLIIIPTWIIVFLIFGYVSLASILAAVAYPIAVYLFYPQDVYKLIFAMIIAVLALYRHKDNLGRLFHGQEHRILYQNRRGAKEK
ncbi:MAG TPA: acyl-phosphate glycerol 3-phosphate acyltransferase [Firmicutes bacterium]|jgi:acyl phosphate:glycerol-3-phosphate acyltransferase|nr:acyl-phosphate glycerol 3-phosphate acyltransferase [Bacillota bacterium]